MIPINQQKQYYDTRWSKERFQLNLLELDRLIVVLSCLRATGINFAIKNIRICDLGSGRGWLSGHLSSFGEVVGVELSESATQEARKRWPHVEFVQADITQYRTESLFDIVISSEVIEHIYDKRMFVDTVNAILRPGGHLIITTPNKKMWPYYEASGAELQPIEEWLSIRELCSMFENSYDVLRSESFLFDHSYRGIFRVLSAPKLIKVLKWARLDKCRLHFHNLLDYGLHQVLYAQYKE